MCTEVLPKIELHENEIIHVSNAQLVKCFDTCIRHNVW